MGRIIDLGSRALARFTSNRIESGLICFTIDAIEHCSQKDFEP